MELASGDLEFATQVLGIKQDKLLKKIEEYDYAEKLNQGLWSLFSRFF